MSYATDEIDQMVLNYMSEQPVALADLERRGIGHDKARNAVSRLLKAGRIERKLEGDERVGRYLYTKKLSDKQLSDRKEEERSSKEILDKLNEKR